MVRRTTTSRKAFTLTLVGITAVTALLFAYSTYARAAPLPLESPSPAQAAALYGLMALWCAFAFYLSLLAVLYLARRAADRPLRRAG